MVIKNVNIFASLSSGLLRRGRMTRFIPNMLH